MEVSQPLVSIVIPVFNRANLVTETLSSIREQSYPRWECILVDDHSVDTVCDVIRSFIAGDARFKLIRRPQHYLKGPSSCRNFGYLHSKGEYVYFFDSDDLMASDLLETLLSLLSKNQDAEYCAFRYAHFIKDKAHTFYPTPNKPEDLTLREAVITCQITCGTQLFFWKRGLLARQPTLWRDDLCIAEDYDFAARMSVSASGGVWYGDRTLVYYRMSNTGLCSTAEQSDESLIKRHASLAAIYELCEDNKIMTDSIRRGLLERSLNYQRQAIYANRMNAFAVMKKYVEKEIVRFPQNVDILTKTRVLEKYRKWFVFIRKISLIKSRLRHRILPPSVIYWCRALKST